MTRPSDEDILRFLEGHLPEGARPAFLQYMDADPSFAKEVREAARALAALDGVAFHQPSPAARRDRRRRVSPWWIPAAVAATLAVAVPLGLRLGERPELAQGQTLVQPVAPQASFVLVLHGRWPDAATVGDRVSRERAAQYWGWTSDLAARGVLVAAGDLRWEPGRRLDSRGTLATAVDGPDESDFVVGMFALRVSTYEEAIAVARECPHLRFGGSVSVRRVGQGFVTVPGMDDWGL